MRRVGENPGPNWDVAKVRGTRFNTGQGLKMALDLGAAVAGHWSGAHAVAWDLAAMTRSVSAAAVNRMP